MSTLAVHVIDHPLAQARLAVLRSVATDAGGFRAALHELSSMLIYEATRDIAVETIEVVTPLAATKGVRVAEPPLLVPVLRAGLGMTDAAHQLVPEAEVGFVGLARDETTRLPALYMDSLPADLRGRRVFVLDPMLATGGSLLHCLAMLAERGAQGVSVVSVLAAPEGVEALRGASIDVRLYTAAVDEHLDEQAFIVPGLGDAGDRQFGPPGSGSVH